MSLTHKQLRYMTVKELVELKRNIFFELEDVINTEVSLRRSLRECIEKEYSLQDDERVVLEELLKVTADPKYEDELRPLHECL